MQGLEISTIISAAPKFLGSLIKPIVSLVSYFSPPEMEVIEQPTKFGRLAGNEFALLLWVKFRNKSDKAVLVTSFEVKHLTSPLCEFS